MTVLILGLSFLAVYGLSEAQVKNSNDRFISILISLIISLINIIISRNYHLIGRGDQVFEYILKGLHNNQVPNIFGDKINFGFFGELNFDSYDRKQVYQEKHLREKRSCG